MDRVRRLCHSSWLFAALFLGITVGVITCRKFPGIYFAPITWQIAGIIIAGVCLRRRRTYWLPIMFLAGGLIGLSRGDAYRVQLLPYGRLFGETISIRGSITDDPDEGVHGGLVLRLGDITENGQSLEGSVWVNVSAQSTLRRGDEVTVKGKLSEGFGSFAASMYRAELIRAERPQPGDVAVEIRDWFAGGVRQAIPEPEASLGVGYLVGQRRSLPAELDKALKAAGLTHIVVASGYNLTILVGAARRLFANISKFLAAFFSGGMIIGFMAVTGLSPSMSRAGLVTGLSLLAWYYGRRFHPLVLLPLAAAVTLLINPSYGWDDLGWQLSFASFAGVLIVAPLLHRYFFGSGEPGVIRQILGETISAWICTVPLIVVAFGQFSNVAILANLVILPLVPLAMLLTFIAGIGALAIPAAAGAAGFPAFMILGYMTNAATYLGGLPWAQTTLALPSLILPAYYAALIGACGYLWYRTKHSFIEQTVVE